ncbi:MAG: antitoxin VbhA family protein [Ruminococcaceae bacterium]|nr:antitoxin VbhA family protein [Oscillospiraceae bacterium]
MTDETRHNLMQAVASARMEGLDFTEEEIKIAEKILDGEMTIEEYVEEIMSE